MMEVDKKKTRTDEAWVRLYARFETDCLLPADAELLRQCTAGFTSSGGALRQP